MSEENSEQKRDPGIEFNSLLLFIKGAFTFGIWFAFCVVVMCFIGTCGSTIRPDSEMMDALYFISGFIILSTIIIVLQFNRLNNSLKEIKKAIEEKQPVIIQRREHSPEQNRQ